MFSVLSPDISLYILSLLSVEDVVKLYSVSRDTRRFLVDNETAIYHQLAVLHRYVSPGTSLGDAVANEQIKLGDWLKGASTWKDLCRRWANLERNWSGQGAVTEGGYLAYSSDVRAFRVDEQEQTIIAVTEASPKRALSVRAIEDGRLLWSLPAVNAIDFSEGYLLLWRQSGSIEIWRRANDVSQESSSVSSPLREPSPLAATATQLKQSPFTLEGKERRKDLRGFFVPHGYLPSFTGAPFRIHRFKGHWLAVVDVAASHVVQLYDVEKGILLRRFDLDAIVQDSSDKGTQVTQSVLLDIDLSSEYLCACFDSLIVVVPMYDDDPVGSTSNRHKISALIYSDNRAAFDLKKTIPQLAKAASTAGSNGHSDIVQEQRGLAHVRTSGTESLEPYVIGPPAEEEETESQAVARPWPGARWSASCFVSARFSPDGRHLISGTAFSLLYLIPDFARILRGTAAAEEIVQKMHVLEPIRDVLWDLHPHRVALRTEPGDTFIMDLVPGFHTDVSLPSDTRPSFDGARILRLRDFASLYGTVFGNMQMRRTGLWLVWDLAQMHQDVRSRVQESGKELVYGTGTNGRKLSPAGLNTRAVTVCYLDFASEL